MRLAEFFNMRKLIFGRDAEVCAWAANNIPHVSAFEKAVTIGVSNDNGIIGAVVFHDYRENDIQMSAASISKMWLTQSILNTIFRYPFIQLKCTRVTSFAPKRNASTRKFLIGLGFVEEGVMRRGFGSDDCVIYGMLKNECRFLKD